MSYHLCFIIALWCGSCGSSKCVSLLQQGLIVWIFYFSTHTLFVWTGWSNTFIPSVWTGLWTELWSLMWIYMYVVILFALHVLFKQNSVICFTPNSMCPVFFFLTDVIQRSDTRWCLLGIKSPKRWHASTCHLSNWFCSNHKKKALPNGLLSIALIIH